MSLCYDRLLRAKSVTQHAKSKICTLIGCLPNNGVTGKTKQNFYSACVWPTALKLGSVTHFDMLFFVMGFISSVD